MNQEAFSEAAKQILVVRTVSVLTGIPIVEPYLQLILTRFLRQGYTALLRPLVGSMDKHALATVCLNTLPCSAALRSAYIIYRIVHVL